MLHDLFLNNSDGDLLAIAKIDISNDTVNIAQKQVSVNDFSFTPLEEDDEDNKALQQKIEAFILPKNHLMSDLLTQLSDIEIIAVFDGETLNPAPTTTTTSTSTSTTTTTTTP